MKNYGRFFHLDNKKTNLAEGILLFRYNGMLNNADYSNRYPIYMTISKEGVDFYLDYYSGEFEISQYSNTPILSLPISSNFNLKDNLTQNLIDIYSTNFPYNNKKDTEETSGVNDSSNNRRKSEFANFVYKYAKDGFKNTEDEGKGVSYSSLKVFNIDYANSEDNLNGFLRKLFLDFLFDLEHSSILKNSPYLDPVYISLNENDLFRAIRNKAEYYYQKELTSKAFLEKQHPISNSFLQFFSKRNICNEENKYKFFLDIFVVAEKNWLDSIMNPISDKIFHISQGWFYSPENELDLVYSSNTEELRCEFKKIKTKEKDNSKLLLNDSSNTAFNWCLHRYKFDGILKIWGLWPWQSEAPKQSSLFTKSITILFFAILLGCLLFGIDLFYFSGNYIASKFTSNVFMLGAFMTFAIIAIFRIRHKKPLAKFIITSIVLLLGIFTFWATEKYLFDDFWQYHYLVIAFTSLVIMLLVWGLGRLRFGNFSVNFFMPRLLASIIAGWFTIAISEDIFKGFFDTQISCYTIFGLSFIVFLFVYHEIAKLNPYIGALRKAFRTFILMYIALMYSILVGLLAIDYFGSVFLERSDYIDEFYLNKVYVAEPEYEIDQNNVKKYVHYTFYKAIEQYNPELIKHIALQYGSLYEQDDESIKVDEKSLLYKSISCLTGDVEQYLKNHENKQSFSYKGISYISEKFLEKDIEKPLSLEVLNENNCLEIREIKYEHTLKLFSLFLASKPKENKNLNKESLGSVGEISSENSSNILTEIHTAVTGSYIFESYVISFENYLLNNKESDELKNLKLNDDDCEKLKITRNAAGEISLDKSWIVLLKTINNHTVYRETLTHLVPSGKDKDGRPIILKELVGNIQVFRNLLLQFSFFAMFVGVFLQLIFEEKPVTEPI